jgi:multiple sugar transport system ATP-binding protein
VGNFKVAVPASAGASAIVGVRPEGFKPTGAGQGFDIKVDVVEELGSDAFVYGKPAASGISLANAEEGAQVIVRWDPKSPPRAGDTISVTADSSAVHLFDAASGKRL